jgi:hypothetical protein
MTAVGRQGTARALQIVRVVLSAPSGGKSALTDFYEQDLGLAPGGPLVFVEVSDGSEPFHHVAFLVPAGRFDAAHAWAAERVGLLAYEGSTIVPFTHWLGRATYFHDPVGNIIELIAHDDETPGRAGADFSPDELLGISEVGLVVDDPGIAADELRRVLGLTLFAGDVTGPGGLGFVGRRRRTLILSAPERGWLPTGRPAEIHPVAVTLTGAGTSGEVILGPHRVAVV